MLITKTNIIKGLTPTVTVGGSSDLPENITREDFSYNYTGSSNSDLTFSFGSLSAINYVAVAGILVKGGGSGSSFVAVFNGGVLVAKTFLKRDHCVVLSFEEQSFSNMKIQLFNATNNQPPTLSFVAAGAVFTVPNGGETAGYNRAWLERGIRQKTTFNGQAAPISSLKKRIPLKGKLNLPNMEALFTQDEWQDFLDFGYSGLFFINEDPTKGESSYICHELANAPVSTHGQTRSSNNVRASFRIFNGL